jgi:type I restriction enzyme R subunit
VAELRTNPHKSFASLIQEEQKYANIFLNDVQRGEENLREGKVLREYITEYQSHAKKTQEQHLLRCLA